MRLYGIKNYCQSQELIGLGIFSYRMSNLKWIQFTFWVHTWNLIHREAFWIVTICKDTEVFANLAQMRNTDTVSKLSNHHRESKSNNDNSVIIVNLRTGGNRNTKGIDSTTLSFIFFTSKAIVEF